MAPIIYWPIGRARQKYSVPILYGSYNIIWQYLRAFQLEFTMKLDQLIINYTFEWTKKSEIRKTCFRQWAFSTVFDLLYFENWIRNTVRRRKLICTQNKLSLILNLDSVKVIWGSNVSIFTVQFRPLDHTVCSILYAAYWMIYTVYIIYHENVDADWKITVQ